MRTLIYSLILSVGFFGLQAKTEPLEKKVKLNFDLNRDAQIDIRASNTNLYIEVWDQPKVEIEVAFRFRGSEHRDKIEEFLKTFDEKVKEGISHSSNSLNIEAYKTLPNKVKIGWEDFTIVQYTFSRDEVQLEYHIKMPADGDVNISHSYRRLYIQGMVANLNLNQYSGRLSLDQVKQGKLSLKYGDATIKQLDGGSLYLYENDLKGNVFGDIELNVKYSQIRLDQIKNAKVQSYESELKFLKANSLSGDLKYSRFDCPLLNSLNISTYESNYTLQELKTLNLSNSKYSRYDIERVDRITIGQAYEDRMRIGSVTDFDAGNSKYCQHKIGQLAKNYSLEGYECGLEIEKLHGPGGEITIKGKYLKVEINTEAAIYKLQASMQYGKVYYDKSSVEGKEVLNGNNTLLNISSKNPAYIKEKAYHILINGYEVKANLL